MNKEENSDFIRKTESLVEPEDVTPISFLGDFNKILPKKLQQKIMEKGSTEIPYMGFIVDPYCLFLAYKITDPIAAQAMLPEGFELEEVSMFEDGPKCPMVIFSAFSARTSAFIGVRLEIYLIARNKDTGLTSWIISDYETNTNSHDPKNGFCGYTSAPTIFTTTPYGELLIDVKGRKSGNEFSITADINCGEFKKLDKNLWIEGNLSVDYGGKLKDASSDTFALIFDPFLMKKAQNLPVNSIILKKNSFMEGIIEWDKPESVALFPYSQHFIIRQDLKRQDLLDEKDLFKEIGTFMDRSGFKRMSGSDIKKPLFRGILLSFLLNWGLIIFLLIKLIK